MCWTYSISEASKNVLCILVTMAGFRCAGFRFPQLLGRQTGLGLVWAPGRWAPLIAEQSWCLPTLCCATF